MRYLCSTANDRILVVAFTGTSVFAQATLKKGAAVCRTKDQFKEFVENRNDQPYMINMLVNGKCKFLLSDAVVPVEVMEGIFPMVKIKMKWGDNVFIGWTETLMINE